MGGAQDNLTKLKEAFETLNRSTEKLTGAYESLQEDTAGLRQKLAESGEFLRDIIDGLSSAVIVTDMENRVILHNAESVKRGFDGGSQIAGWLACASEGIHAGKRIVGEWKGAGDEVFEISIMRFNPVDGGPGGQIFVIADITELARLKKQATRTEKLRALGEMAAGLAHEIRNPLGGMELFASILRRELEGDDEKLRLLNHISYGIQSVNNVIGNVLLFTKEITPARKEFDLKRLVEDILEFTGPVFEKSQVTVTAILPDKPLPVTADEGLIRQLMLNLVRNAIQAMPDGGEFGVKLASPGNAGNRSGSVEIVVSDTGPGVPAKVRDRIFDPFFTTKDGGAGLGLAIASQIAQAHGGYIDLLDSSESGARFMISLPIE
jgi:two-component system sensor histidine kinase FlrB